MGNPARELADRLHLLGLPELRLEFPAFRDVRVNSNQANELAPFIPDGVGAHFDRDMPPVIGHHVRFSLPGAAVHDRLKYRPANGLVGIERDLCQWFGQFRSSIAEHIDKSPVVIGEAAFRIGDGNGLAGAINARADEP